MNKDLLRTRVFVCRLRFIKTCIVACFTSIVFWPASADALTDCSLENIALTSQSEVDNFQYVYGGGGICDHVTGDLAISGSDIDSLAPLSDLAAIGNDLIIRENPLLANLAGLSAITTIGRHLDITLNPTLAQLEGLSGLAGLGGVLWVRENGQLGSVGGLSSLASIGLSLVVDDNGALTSISGLSNLKTLGLHVGIRRNPLLATVAGLAGIQSIGGSLFVGFNPVLENLELTQLAAVSSDVLLLDNASLADISQLSKLTRVGRDLFLADNPALGDCSSLGPLLDAVDDGAPGPGPGFSDVPDVGNEIVMYGNQHGCNSRQQVLFQIMASGFESTNQITTVEYETGQGSCGLAIGSDGLPIISYASAVNSSHIRTAKCSDERCSRNGLIVSVIDDSLGSQKGFSSMAIGNDGMPFIQYVAFFFAPSWLKSAKCNDLACSGGDESISTLTTTNGIAGGGSVAIGDDGFPVISYIASSDQLAVIKCNDAACLGDDEIRSFLSLSGTGYFGTSIAIGADDFPVISYMSDQNLTVAKCNDAACTGGDETISTVEDSENLVGLFSSIAIGADDNPIVAYIDNSALSLKVAKCNDPACGGGDEQLSTVDVGKTDVLSGPAIAIGLDGMPVISYGDASDWSLKVAKCHDAACSEGNVTIHRLDATARYTSIAVAADGRPVIGYCGSVKQAEPVKILRCGTLDCRP